MQTTITTKSLLGGLYAYDYGSEQQISKFSPLIRLSKGPIKAKSHSYSAIRATTKKSHSLGYLKPTTKYQNLLKAKSLPLNYLSVTKEASRSLTHSVLVTMDAKLQICASDRDPECPNSKWTFRLWSRTQWGLPPMKLCEPRQSRRNKNIT